jgi:hypothetical protein
MKRTKCKRCLLPAKVPGSDLDGSGVCAWCRAHNRADANVEELSRLAREQDLEHTLQTCRGAGDFDCLVNLSGGKDSCYLVYRLLVDYKLRVLAFTTDMNVPPVAWENIRRTISTLGVKHVVYTPPKGFYQKLFRFLLTNQEDRGAVRTVCYVCAPLFEGYSLRLAVEQRIPVVFAGYSPGQPDPDRMVYEFPQTVVRETDWTPPEVRNSGLFDDEELTSFWNPLIYPSGTQFPRYLAPFHAWRYNQADVMQKVVKLGLISNSRRASPVHSNCPVNWLLMYSDLKNLGYNPYAPEFSALIRQGKASRWYWLLMGPVVNAMIRSQTFLGRNVKESFRWLNLRDEDLRITRPASACNYCRPEGACRSKLEVIELQTESR